MIPICDLGDRRPTWPEEERAAHWRPLFCPLNKESIHLATPALVAGLLLLFMAGAARQLNAGQDDHKKRLPVLDKITAAPNGQNEFNGRVLSLDLKAAVLNVQSLREDDTEIFPIRKTVTVAAANGYRVDISTLKPGTNILVYFEQRGDKRKVKEIVVLGSAPPEGAKAQATPPPS